MSKKPAKIDIARPQDYITRGGFEVKYLKMDHSNKYIMACIDVDGTEDLRFYDVYGSYKEGIRDEKDLIFRSEFEGKLNNLVERKVVQIAVAAESESDFQRIFALTEDGNLYVAHILLSFNNPSLIKGIEPWIKVPPIPKD